MPLQRRLPKRGFVSRRADDTAEVRLSRSREAAGRRHRPAGAEGGGAGARRRAKTAKVIKTGKLDKAVKLTGVLATKGAKAAIEAAGGSVA